MENHLETIVKDLKSNLGSGLLACDLWVKQTGLSVAGYNHNSKYSAILNKMVTDLEESLKDIGLPAFKQYQITDLEMNTLLVTIKLGNTHYLGCLIDKSKTAFGTLLHIVIPNIVEAFNDFE